MHVRPICPHPFSRAPNYSSSRGRLINNLSGQLAVRFGRRRYTRIKRVKSRVVRGPISTCFLKNFLVFCRDLFVCNPPWSGAPSAGSIRVSGAFSSRLVPRAMHLSYRFEWWYIPIYVWLWYIYISFHALRLI